MAYPANGTWLSTLQFAICIIFLVICTTFLTLRLWSRTLQRGLRPRALTVSDAVVTVGYLATVGSTVCFLTAISIGGSGQHVWNVSSEQQENNQKALFTSAFFWLTATCTLKMSILVLYVEIFQSQNARRGAYAILGLVATFYVGFLIAIFTQCFPFSMNWDKNEHGHCGNLTAESRAGAFINLIFDTMITVFPIPMIWGLQMPLKKRIGLVILFGLGTAADGINVSRAAISMNPSGDDYIYFSAKTNILAGMELWLGVIIACAPLIRPALTQLHITQPTASQTYSSRSRPMYRSDPEALSGHGSAHRSPSVPMAAVKRLDPWERQFKYLESEEDIVPLRDLSHCSSPEPPRSGSLATT